MYTSPHSSNVVLFQKHCAYKINYLFDCILMKYLTKESLQYFYYFYDTWLVPLIKFSFI